MMYSGDDGIYTSTFRYDKKPDCAVCGEVAKPLRVDPGITLRELLDSFAIQPDLQLKKPSLRAEGKTLYMQSPPSIEEQTRPNLDKTLKNDLGLDVGHEIVVTDPAFPALIFRFILNFTQTIS